MSKGVGTSMIFDVINEARELEIWLADYVPLHAPGYYLPGMDKPFINPSDKLFTLDKHHVTVPYHEAQVMAEAIKEKDSSVHVSISAAACLAAMELPTTIDVYTPWKFGELPKEHLYDELHCLRAHQRMFQFMRTEPLIPVFGLELIQCIFDFFITKKMHWVKQSRTNIFDEIQDFLVSRQPSIQLMEYEKLHILLEEVLRITSDLRRSMYDFLGNDSQLLHFCRREGTRLVISKGECISTMERRLRPSRMFDVDGIRKMSNKLQNVQSNQDFMEASRLLDRAVELIENGISLENSIGNRV